MPTHAAARPNRRSGAALKIVLAGVAALAAIGSLATVAQGRAKTDKGGTLELHTVAPSSFDIAVTANGELEAKSQTEIRSKLEKPTTIVEIVDEGKRVSEGDVLVKLNAEDIETQLNQETLSVESATAESIAAVNAYDIQVNENQSNLDKAKVQLDLARIEYQKWLEGDDHKDRQKNALAIEKTTREKERLEEKAQKSEELYKQDFLSKDQYEQDKTAAIEAAANYKTAMLASQVYESYEREKMSTKLLSDIRQAESEAERVVSKNASLLASKEAERNNKKKQLQLRQDKLAKLQEQFANATIRAPQEGLVVYGSTAERSRWGGGGGDDGLKIGAQVHSNQLLIVLPDIREMVASVRVHEANAGRIRPGQPASIRIDAAQGRTFSGTVQSIGVLAESGGWRDPNLREYTVKLALDSSNDISGLKPSMRCEAEIVLGSVSEVLTVPIQAVFNDGPVRFVYTPKGSKYIKTPVKVGRRSDVYAEVRAGLNAGDRVLLREPTPGEVLATTFDEAQLAALDKAAPDEMRGGPGMRRAAPGAPGGAPAGAVPGAGGAQQGAKGRPERAKAGDAKPVADAATPDSKPEPTTAAKPDGAAQPAGAEAKPADTGAAPAATPTAPAAGAAKKQD